MLFRSAQSGPGVFKGDLHFYSVDHDFRDLCRKISGRVPMYLMTGVYDFACTPEMSQQTADKIKNSECIIMDGIGHFPMSENPEVFKEYLMPVLKKILQSDRESGRVSERGHGPSSGHERAGSNSQGGAYGQASRDDTHGRGRERANQNKVIDLDDRGSHQRDSQRSTDRGAVRVVDFDTSGARNPRR